MVIAQELEPDGMEIVRTGARLRAHHAGVRAELGVVIGRRDFGLGHGFERRIDDDQAEHRVVVVSAVEQVRRAREALAVDDLAKRTRGSSRGGLARKGRHAGREDFNRRELDWGSADWSRPFGEHDSHVAAFGLQHGTSALISRTEVIADLQLHINPRLLIHRD